MENLKIFFKKAKDVMEQEEQKKGEVKNTGRKGLSITTAKAKPSIFIVSYQIRSNVFNLMERHDKLPCHLSFFFPDIYFSGWFVEMFRELRWI